MIQTDEENDIYEADSLHEDSDIENNQEHEKFNSTRYQQDGTVMMNQSSITDAYQFNKT